MLVLAASWLSNVVSLDEAGIQVGQAHCNEMYLALDPGAGCKPDRRVQMRKLRPSRGRGFLMTRRMGLERLGSAVRAESYRSDRLSVGGRPMYPTFAMGNCTILCTGYSYGSRKTSGDDARSPRMS